MVTKICTKCKKVLPLTEENFQFFQARGKSRIKSQCKSCAFAYRQRYYNLNKEKVLERCRKWESNKSENYRLIRWKSRLKSQYKLTIAELEQLLLEQNNSCKICFQQFSKISSEEHRTKPRIDHNHKTGKIRGLLCDPCNIAVGLLRDSPELAFKLGKYLQDTDN